MSEKCEHAMAKAALALSQNEVPWPSFKEVLPRSLVGEPHSDYLERALLALCEELDRRMS